MKIVCTICRDLLIPSDDIFVIRCGHVFHFRCLSQWLDRSKSCPQCREKATESRIHRLFFTFPNNEAASENSSSQERIDNLKFQVLLNEKNIKYYISQNAVLQKQNAGLRQEVRKVESEINKKNSIIYSLKEQMKYLENLEKTVSRTKKELEKLQCIQTALKDSVGEANETKDYNSLTTYIFALKKVMLKNVNKRKQLHHNIQELQERIIQLTLQCESLSEEQTKRLETEERLAMCENKNLILQNRICELEQLLKIAPELSDVIVTEQEKVLQNSVSIENLDARLSNIKVNSQRNLNGDSLTNERGIETVTVQPNVRQEAESYNDSLSPKTGIKIVTSPAMIKRTRESCSDNKTNDLLAGNVGTDMHSKRRKTKYNIK